jgi:hypothetical protein
MLARPEACLWASTEGPWGVRCCLIPCGIGSKALTQTEVTGSARGYTCGLWNLTVTITVLSSEMMPFSRYVAVAVLVILVAACERQADAVKVTGVTTFDARVVGLSWSPAEHCDGRKRACTRAKIVVTNVGADEGDSMCSVRMLDAQGQKVTDHPE